MHVVDANAALFHFGLAGIEEPQSLAVHVVHTLEGGADADGPAHGPHLDRELVLQLVQQVEGIAAFQIQLVDEDDDGRVAHAAHFHQPFGLRFHALYAVDHQHHAVHGGEGAVSVFGEVAVARCVQQVDELAAVAEGHHRGAHADAALPLDLHEVAGGAPPDLVALYRARRLYGASVEEELLGERGLARIGVTDDREGPAVLDLFLQTHGRRVPCKGAPNVALGRW